MQDDELNDYMQWKNMNMNLKWFLNTEKICFFKKKFFLYENVQ